MKAGHMLFGFALLAVLLVPGISAQGVERTCTPVPWDPDYPECNPCLTLFGEYPTDCMSTMDGITCTCVAGTVAGWKCKDAYTSGYQNTDGSWTNLQSCPLGCSNGACNVQPPSDTCQEGWRCKDSNTKGYRLSDCTWTNVETCEGGCFGGTCLGGKNVHRVYRTCSCSGGACSCTDQDRIFQQCLGGCLNGGCVNTPAGEVSVDFMQMVSGGAGAVLSVLGLLLMVI